MAKPWRGSRRALASAALALGLGIGGAAGAAEGQGVVIGQAFSLASEVLGEERPLLVHLPRSYQRSPDTRFPVLYLLDAEAHFHHVTGLTDFLAAQGLAPEMIVVGVINTHRLRDFTAAPEERAPGSGGAPGFLAFFRDELVPWVEGRYRTAPHRTLFGHSATGNFGLWTLAEAPGLLDAVVAASPWVIWADAHTVRHAEERWRDRAPGAAFLYFTAGDEPELLPDLERYVRLLRRRARGSLDWHYQPMPRDDHGSLVPATLLDGLRRLYAGWRLPGEVTTLAGLRRHYAGLSERLGYPVTPPEAVVNLLGYRLLQAGARREAVAVLAANAEAFPASANVHDSLGEALEAMGDLAGAAQRYERAVGRGEANGDLSTDAYRDHLTAVRRRLATAP
jgi:hypothetical protein